MQALPGGSFPPPGRWAFDWSFAGYKGKPGMLGHAAPAVLAVAAAVVSGTQQCAMQGWSLPPPADGDALLPAPSTAAKYDVVADFGAKGDGKADDTAALQSAVAAASAEGGIIQLPAGTYLLSAPLLVTGSGVVLRGDAVSRGQPGVAFSTLQLTCWHTCPRARPRALRGW